MEYENLLTLLDDVPVFESAMLLAGDVSPESVRLQLSRWTKSGWVYQLRRGLYTLAPPYQKVKPHPFLIANHLQRASYVSVQSALAFYGLIPETVQATLSVTAGRPERLKTPLGVFGFQHIQADLLHGYRMTRIQVPNQPDQQALIATPEKALLDLIYLQPGGDGVDYLRELRLQNLDLLDMDELHRLVDLFNLPKLRRAAEAIAQLVRQDAKEYVTL